MLALLVFVPGVVLLCHPDSAVVFRARYRRLPANFQQSPPHVYHTVESVRMEHVRVFGVLALLASGGLCVFYLRLRRDIRRDELLPDDAQKPLP